MNDNLRKKIGSIPKRTWILIAIILIGIFLRTYKFHSWLEFERDQVRDAFLVNDVVQGKEAWPIFGPTIKDSQDETGELFKIGPAYYYMQITSAKLFGSSPEKMAYPDLLFSILTIPLLYLFLRRYFKTDISLILTGLFAISAFSLQYSRFAWNPNIIPFFTLLFLLSLHEMLAKKKGVSWRWIIFSGIALGIGIQLHVVTLVLFPLVAFFVFSYLLAKDFKIFWKRIVCIFLVVLVFNSTQVFSELKTGFSNSRIFFNSILLNDAKNKESLFSKIGNTLDCHAEANAFMLLAAGDDKCKFIHDKVLSANESKKIKREVKDAGFISKLLLIFIFSLLGYAYLFYLAKKEKNSDKKYFLRLIVLFAFLSFLIMAPIANPDHSEFRYFLHSFFVPYVFLGLGFQVIARKKGDIFKLAAIAICSFIILTNYSRISSEVEKLNSRNKSNDHYCVLGEVEKILDYMILNSGGDREVYLYGKKRYVSTLYYALQYMAQRDGFNIMKVDDKDDITADASVFYLSYPLSLKDDASMEIDNRRIISFENFGQISVYNLEN